MYMIISGPLVNKLEDNGDTLKKNILSLDQMNPIPLNKKSLCKNRRFENKMKIN